MLNRQGGRETPAKASCVSIHLYMVVGCNQPHFMKLFLPALSTFEHEHDSPLCLERFDGAGQELELNEFICER
jgi:hypothetical protein